MNAYWIIEEWIGGKWYPLHRKFSSYDNALEFGQRILGLKFRVRKIITKNLVGVPK